MNQIIFHSPRKFNKSFAPVGKFCLLCSHIVICTILQARTANTLKDRASSLNLPESKAQIKRKTVAATVTAKVRLTTSGAFQEIETVEQQLPSDTGYRSNFVVRLKSGSLATVSQSNMNAAALR